MGGLSLPGITQSVSQCGKVVILKCSIFAPIYSLACSCSPVKVFLESFATVRINQQYMVLLSGKS